MSKRCSRCHNCTVRRWLLSRGRLTPSLGVIVGDQLTGCRAQTKGECTQFHAQQQEAARWPRHRCSGAVLLSNMRRSSSCALQARRLARHAHGQVLQRAQSCGHRVHLGRQGGRERAAASNVGQRRAHLHKQRRNVNAKASGGRYGRRTAVWLRCDLLCQGRTAASKAQWRALIVAIGSGRGTLLLALLRRRSSARAPGAPPRPPRPRPAAAARGSGTARTSAARAAASGLPQRRRAAPRPRARAASQCRRGQQRAAAATAARAALWLPRDAARIQHHAQQRSCDQVQQRPAACPRRCLACRCARQPAAASRSSSALSRLTASARRWSHRCHRALTSAPWLSSSAAASGGRPGKPPSTGCARRGPSRRLQHARPAAGASSPGGHAQAAQHSAVHPRWYSASTGTPLRSSASTAAVLPAHAARCKGVPATSVPLDVAPLLISNAAAACRAHMRTRRGGLCAPVCPWHRCRRPRPAAAPQAQRCRPAPPSAAARPPKVVTTVTRAPRSISRRAAAAWPLSAAQASARGHTVSGHRHRAALTSAPPSSSARSASTLRHERRPRVACRAAHACAAAARSSAAGARCCEGLARSSRARSGPPAGCLRLGRCRGRRGARGLAAGGRDLGPGAWWSSGSSRAVPGGA